MALFNFKRNEDTRIDLQTAVMFWDDDVDRLTAVGFHQQTLPESNPNFPKPIAISLKPAQ